MGRYCKLIHAYLNPTATEAILQVATEQLLGCVVKQGALWTRSDSLCNPWGTHEWLTVFKGVAILRRSALNPKQGGFKQNTPRLHTKLRKRWYARGDHITEPYFSLSWRLQTQPLSKCWSTENPSICTALASSMWRNEMCGLTPSLKKVATQCTQAFPLADLTQSKIGSSHFW
jgi:hypothetical protein